MKLVIMAAGSKLTAVSSIQFLQSNRHCCFEVTFCIYLFLYIKMQERLIKIKLVLINNSYLRFKNLPVLNKL